MIVTRITADIDKSSMNLSLHIVRRAILQFKINAISIEFRLSSSKKGHHIIIFCDNYFSNKEIFEIRKFLGDDSRRLNRDIRRKIPKQYLFKEKTKLK